MKIYNTNNLEEWSRVLSSRYGPNFRIYSGEKETMERWANHLSNIYCIEPGIKGNYEGNLINWSKMIGG